MTARTNRDATATRQERKRLAEARDRARLAIAAIADHVTDTAATDRESHRYRGRLGWAAGSLRADIRAIEDYFAELDEACRAEGQEDRHGPF